MWLLSQQRARKGLAGAAASVERKYSTTRARQSNLAGVTREQQCQSFERMHTLYLNEIGYFNSTV